MHMAKKVEGEKRGRGKRRLGESSSTLCFSTEPKGTRGKLDAAIRGSSVVRMSERGQGPRLNDTHHVFTLGLIFLSQNKQNIMRDSNFVHQQPTTTGIMNNHFYFIILLHN